MLLPFWPWRLRRTPFLHGAHWPAHQLDGVHQLRSGRGGPRHRGLRPACAVLTEFAAYCSRSGMAQHSTAQHRGAWPQGGGSCSVSHVALPAACLLRHAVMTRLLTQACAGDAGLPAAGAGGGALLLRQHDAARRLLLQKVLLLHALQSCGHLHSAKPGVVPLPA